jgi:hypothetical protein
LETQNEDEVVTPHLFVVIDDHVRTIAYAGSGCIRYAALNGAFEFRLMAGGYQSQPQGKTQLNGFHYWNGSFHV